MSFSETIFLFLLALIIFGPKKLPEIARQVGKYLNEFRRASNEFKAQIEQEISHLEREDRHKILPPSEPPSGATGRDLATIDAKQTVAEVPATLASSSEEASHSAVSSVPAAVEATEAGPVADSEKAAAASQESHA